MGGGSYHRLWLAAHFVHAAAGTNTAADEDEQNDDRADNTKDHVHWCGMIENRLGFTLFLFILRKLHVTLATAVSVVAGTTAKFTVAALVPLVHVGRICIGHTVRVPRGHTGAQDRTQRQHHDTAQAGRHGFSSRIPDSGGGWESRLAAGEEELCSGVETPRRSSERGDDSLQ